MPDIGLIILAAGSSSRLGTPKQLLQFRGQTLLARTIDAGLQSACSELIVVLGAQFEQISSTIDNAAVQIVRNIHWHEGMASSIRCGIAALTTNVKRIDTTVIVTCDQPFLSSEVIDTLIDTYETTRQPVVACKYAGTVGVPALFDRTLFGQLDSLTGSSGAKQIILHHHNNLAHVAFPQGAVDIDTTTDYESLLTSET